jgi:hypothetical protein
MMRRSPMMDKPRSNLDHQSHGYDAVMKIAH